MFIPKFTSVSTNVGNRKIKKIKLKIIIKNMQKLPDDPDRKRGDACAKKRNRLDKRKNLVLFQQCTAE